MKQRIVYFLFFLSGFPALAYQVVWQRMISLHFGVDIYSTSVTVAIFMLGLGVGSLYGGFIADKSNRVLRWYVFVELSLAVMGIISPWLITYVGQLFGGTDVLFLVLINFLLLILPTVLMGMTLPLIMKIVIYNQIDQPGRGIAKLYAVNTFGAATGALLTSYFIIGFVGLQGTAWIAASINIILGIAIYLTFKGTNTFSNRVNSNPVINNNVNLVDSAILLIASFLSGWIALSYEMIWYRILQILLHSTVYTFGTILFVHLAALAMGAHLAKKRIENGRNVDRFALCQAGIAIYMTLFILLVGRFGNIPGIRHLIGASFFTSFHPSAEFTNGVFTFESIYSFAGLWLWTGLAMIIPSILMGYGFSNLLAHALNSYGNLKSGIGKMYLVNIIGSTMGTFLTGFYILHIFGVSPAVKILVLTGLLLGLFLISKYNKKLIVTYGVITALMLVVVVTIFPSRKDLQRGLHYSLDPKVEFDVLEDRTGVVAFRTQNKMISFPHENQILGEQRVYIDGSCHGGYKSKEEKLNDKGVSAALMLFNKPVRVLSIGLGDGRMCATALQSNKVSELIIVEINESLKDLLKKTVVGKSIFDDSRTKIRITDGRKWLLSNKKENFDLIIMWPLHAAHAYYGNLYSKEFFELVKSRFTENKSIFMTHTVDAYSTAKTLAVTFSDVVRLGSMVYLCSMDSLNIFGNKEIPEFTKSLIQADKNFILKNTVHCKINKDLFPNSEYYITYSYSEVLQTRNLVEIYHMN
jgi:predicted membrane-bound spermidine synthase